MPNSPPEPATDVPHVAPVQRRSLDVFFTPRTVAVIGAVEAADAMAQAVLQNLTATAFGGSVFAVTPYQSNLLGQQTFPSIGEVPGTVDLAVITSPAPAVPEIIDACVAAGVKGAIVMSDGFRQAGPGGVALEQQLLERAAKGGLRVLGPNSLGVMNPRGGLNATCAGALTRPGTLAFLSQSSALASTILDWSFQQQVGFSAFVALGALRDVGWGDLIYYLGEDPQTESIVIYMESVGDARSFLSAAREVALSKPIIVLKAGRTEAAALAVASHTGALAEQDAVLDAAFRRCGVLRVATIADLFDMAEVLAKQPRPRGPRLAILTNAGGPGVLAADALIASGGELASLTPETLAALGKLLPDQGSVTNPVDLGGDASAGRYAQGLEILARDAHSDGLLVILTPQRGSDPFRTAQQIASTTRSAARPILASWMGAAAVSDGEAILNRARIPTFPYPDAAAQAFHAMWRYSQALRGLYETPLLPTGSDADAPDRAAAEGIVQAARNAGRTLLTEVESKQLLAAYAIPTVATLVATSPEAAVAHAEQLGYPVVLKLHSEQITHKSAVGGVELYLFDKLAVERAYERIAAAVKAATGPGKMLGVTVQPMVRADGYELLVGSNVDPQFGPVLLFGAGGRLAEVWADTALALPPLNTTLARRTIERTRISAALRGEAGRPAADLAALDRLLVRFSQLLVEQRAVKEIDINPLLAVAGANGSSPSLLALDARVILHGPEVAEAALPPLAIRPYPTRYVQPWTMRDGTTATIRPIRPEDEPLMVAFHQTLSAQSVFLRYFSTLKLAERVAHERLTRICFIDYDRDMALVAHGDSGSGKHQILAVGRLNKIHNTGDAEFAILVGDPWQRSGLGTELLQRLIQIGRDEQQQRIVGYILADNRGMLRVCERLGFRRRPGFHDPIEVVLTLRDEAN